MSAVAGLLRRQRLSVASLTAAALILGALLCFLDIKVVRDSQRSVSALLVNTPFLQPKAPVPETGGSKQEAWRDASRPRIYIYELPLNFTQCSIENLDTFIYGAERRVPDTIAASRFVTKDPETADLFYVPAALYCIQGTFSLGIGVGTGGHRTIALAVLEYIRAAYPFWDRKQGADHVWLFAHDHGFCGFSSSEGGVPELQRSIILSHWGLTTNEIDCTWRSRLRNFATCPERQNLMSMEAKAMPCFRPGQDIVIAHPAADWVPYFKDQEVQDGNARTVDIPAMVEQDPDSGLSRIVDSLAFSFPRLLPDHHRLQGLAYNETELAEAFEGFTELILSSNSTEETKNATLDFLKENWLTAFGHLPWNEAFMMPTSAVAEKKVNTFFFSGDLRYKDAAYSHGVRQAIWTLFRNTSGLMVVDNSVAQWGFAEMAVEMGRSTFCLATTGAGWGVRLKFAAMFHCIPVVIPDNVQVEFEEILPYKDFALRIPQHALYMLPTLLDSVMKDRGRVAAMQQRLACAWRYLSWHSEHGRALEALICAFRRRLPDLEKPMPIMDWETCTLYCG